jgi:DNA-binding transcriptional LysR family regulator
MDRIEAMRTFSRVAELGSFAAVAEQAGVARSAITRQVAALERHLGTQLLTRSTRRVSLTAAGASYLEKCRVIMNLVEAAETGAAEHRATPRGPIRLSLPLVYGIRRLAPLLLDFAERYPEIELDMDYSDRRVNLIEEGIDLSIRITARLADDDVVRRLGTARLQVVGSPDYVARHGAPQRPADLAGHECLLYTTDFRRDAWPFVVDGRVETVAVRGRVHASNGEALAEAAARGLGLALQPDFIVERFAGRLVRVLEDHPCPELGIYAVLPSNRYVPHRVRVLIEFLQERLRAPVDAASRAALEA